MSTRSLPRGSLEYAAWITGFSAALMLGGWFFKIPSAEALEDISAFLLAIFAIAALVWALRGRWREAVITFATPLSFATAAFAAESWFEAQVLGMAAQTARAYLITLMVIAIAFNVRVTADASDEPPGGGYEEGHASVLRATMLMFAFAAPPTSSAYALYFVRGYTLTHEYPPTAFYVETVFIILSGLAIALIAGLLAEFSAPIVTYMRTRAQSVAERARAFSRRLEQRRPRRRSA